MVPFFPITLCPTGSSLPPCLRARRFFYGGTYPPGNLRPFNFLGPKTPFGLISFSSFLHGPTGPQPLTPRISPPNTASERLWVLPPSLYLLQIRRFRIPLLSLLVFQALEGVKDTIITTPLKKILISLLYECLEAFRSPLNFFPFFEAAAVLAQKVSLEPADICFSRVLKLPFHGEAFMPSPP